MFISRIKGQLQKYPHVTYTATPNKLEIPAQGRSGFPVWVQEQLSSYVIGFAGWHEEFSDPDEAFECFGFGLSDACRLRVFSRGGMDYKWQVLHQVNGQWSASSEVGLFLFPFWCRRQKRDLRNVVLTAT
jgi:hypothetical protein